jgi:hypothetical protein
MVPLYANPLIHTDLALFGLNGRALFADHLFDLETVLRKNEHKGESN